MASRSGSVANLSVTNSPELILVHLFNVASLHSWFKTKKIRDKLLTDLLITTLLDGNT
jgi:hypothetical protein